MSSVNRVEPGELATGDLGGSPGQPGSLIEQQDASAWCWAACIQCVARQAGMNLNQAQISTIAHGWPMDRPESPQLVAALLNHLNLRAWVVNQPATPQELVATLRSGWKIIALIYPGQGPVGHFVVLEGVTADNRLVVSDSRDGTTRTYAIPAIYRSRWVSSVVVGKKVRS